MWESADNKVVLTYCLQTYLLETINEAMLPY